MTDKPDPAQLERAVQRRALEQNPNLAREQLRRSIDGLAERANLYGQMQKDPLKIIGGATGVGLVLGLLVGSRAKRTRRIYVDANSSKKEQNAFAKAQLRTARGGRGGIGGALVAAATTIAIRVLQDRVLRPQLEQFADRLVEQGRARAAGQPAPGTAATVAAPESGPVTITKG